MEVNEQYVKQTMEALSDNRLTTSMVAHQISRFPAREQTRFFKLLINYIELMSDLADKGYALMGMQDIAKACQELMEVIESYFPAEKPSQLQFEGMEYIQL
jgi:hypothetical protein